MKKYMETEVVNLPTVQSFKYIGSMIDRRAGASKDVESRVAKAWSKRRELSGVLCDKKVPTKLKILIYQKLLENLNPYKSARPDGIKPNILKELAIYIAPFLIIIFNIAFDTGTIPAKWKRQLSNQSTKRQQI